MSDIHIKPSHRGRLTELKARTGKSEAELYNDGNPAHKKMVVFARNARKWNRADGGLLISPEKKNLLDRVNSSRADFVQRMKDPNRAYITNPDGTVSTHRLAYATNGNDAVVYPEIQNIGGNLVEVPADMAYQSAVDRGDTLHMTPKQAKWFTKNYHKYYPFKMYAGGGSTQNAILYDYFQSNDSPLADTLFIQPQSANTPAYAVKTSVDAPDPVYMPVVESPVVPQEPAFNPMEVTNRLKQAAAYAAATKIFQNTVPREVVNTYIRPQENAAEPEYAPSEDLIQSLIGYEGFLERPSRKIDGKWTIGYGDTDKALNDYYLKNPNKKYNKAEAEKRLRDRVANEFLPELKKSVPNWDRLTPQQKDSLLSYAYNVGKYFTSTHKNFVSAMKDFDIVRAAKELNAGWNQRDKSTGKPLYGLRKRRIREQRAFLGDKFSVGGVIDKLKKTYYGDAKAMLEAVRKAKSETYEQM